MSEHALGPLFERPIRELARSSDSETSKDAAIQAQDAIVREHQGKILKALSRAAWRGASAKEMEQGTGLTSVQITRRIHELRKAGLIVTFDGKSGDGHRTPAVRRLGCSVHATVEHASAASAIFTQQQRKAS